MNTVLYQIYCICMFVIYLFLPDTSVTLVIAVKVQAKYEFCLVAILLFISCKKIRKVKVASFLHRFIVPQIFMRYVKFV
jgi:hypothetical protein